MTGSIVVLDVGKTISKLTLWSAEGDLVSRRTRSNAPASGQAYAALDHIGIERWLIDVLSEFASQANVGHIVPVGHGAAAAVIRDGALVCPPLDYEQPIPAAVRSSYDADRDSFALTGSPSLPDGLNLGVQFAFLESLGIALAGATIMPWPQYWAWYLSGVAASEVTSLGCHTDLWLPGKNALSPLAARCGWAELLAPLRPAGEVLGPLRSEVAQRTGLPRTTVVHCGIHDSNAALLAARSFPDIVAQDSTVLSTGTWFIGMRTPATAADVDIAALPENRDCLVNVDVAGRPVPSARFMGGREIEILTGQDGDLRLDLAGDQGHLCDAVPRVLASDIMALPTFAPGCGPFPNDTGRWVAAPRDAVEQRVAAALYAAMVADTSLDLTRTRGRLLIEGRFAGAQVFTRALATIRPDLNIYVADEPLEASFGALRLVDPKMSSRTCLVPVAPFSTDAAEYRQRWRGAVAGASRAGDEGKGRTSL